ncbi:MAG: hypothetical protein EOP83_08695 [Verrucomicrobiaceae bacterium]|nr:MAG: hypothetical protein EOP83_08695 [Verrucomicrobiaceae bacterium]
MYDDDDLSRERVTYGQPFLTDDVYDQAMAEAKTMVLPFDLHNVLDDNPFIYSPRSSGPLNGSWVKYTGGQVQTVDGQPVELDYTYGVVVSHEFNRVVIAFEHDQDSWVYLGWVNPEDYTSVRIHEEPNRWTH